MAKSKKQPAKPKTKAKAVKKPELLKCEYCPKTFKRASGMTVHVKIKHPETQLTDSQALIYSMGRPSKYEQRFCEMLLDHMNVEKFEKVVMEKETRYSAKTGVKVSEKEKYKLLPNDLPTLEGFARKIGVAYKNMHAWSEAVEDPEAVEPVYKYPDFRNAYNVAKQLQKEFLIDNGLKGNYPPAAYIFTAKNVTDMTDKQIIETNDADYKDKEDALDKWFDSIRDDIKPVGAEAGADTPPAEDVQKG